MSKNYFTPEQLEQLRENKYFKNTFEKANTYTEEFILLYSFFILDIKGFLPF